MNGRMAEAKKGRGCFFYGCVTTIVLFIAVVIGIFFAVRYGFKVLRDQYTSPQGVAVAPVRLPAADGDRAVKRVDDFKKSLQSGTALEPLELSADELDYVFRNSAKGSQFKDHAHLTITNDAIHAELSLPLGAFHPALQGRFFNGDAKFDLEVQNGAIVADLQSATVNGKDIPGEALSNMKQSMQWRPQSGDPEAPLVNNLERIDIKDGKIVLVPKGK